MRTKKKQFWPQKLKTETLQSIAANQKQASHSSALKPNAHRLQVVSSSIYCSEPASGQGLHQETYWSIEGRSRSFGLVYNRLFNQLSTSFHHRQSDQAIWLVVSEILVILWSPHPLCLICWTEMNGTLNLANLCLCCKKEQLKWQWTQSGLCADKDCRLWWEYS